MSLPRSVAFHTLGCKLNFAESSTIARQFKNNGFTKVNFTQKADVYVINTCSVTDNADRECKTHVHRALNLNPEAFIAVIGCYAQLKPDEIAGIPGVSLVLGATEKFNIINYIDKVRQAQTKIVACEIADAVHFTSSYSSGDRTRVFLKVQDGCDYGCAFCTIPLARGKSRSDGIENILKQTEKIIADGAKEIVLTGVNLGDFGKEVTKDESWQLAVNNQQNNNYSNHKTESQSFENPLAKKHQIPTTPKESMRTNFVDLVKALDTQPGSVRYRISSIEPNLLTDEIISHVSSSIKFMPHFHIPLQSGSNKILKLMRRRYLVNVYVSRVSKIKELMPDACIGADVITGFPGETEEDFLETYNFLNALDISYLHVFTYSERNNTLAYDMPHSVPMHHRKRRTNMLRILSAKKLHHFYLSQVGKVFKVLFEADNKNGFMHGFTQNYVKVKTEYNSEFTNTIQTCKLTGIDEDGEMCCQIFSMELA